VEVFSLYYMEWNILKHGSGLVQVQADNKIHKSKPQGLLKDVLS